MRPSAFATLVALLLLVLGSGCRRPAGNPPPPTPASLAPQKPHARLTVFAGAASKPALEVLARTYRDRSGVVVDITFGGSGAVLTQFSQEQYGDVYVPGSDDFMDRAEAKGAVLKETRRPLAYLVPALCVAAGNPKHVRGLADLARQDLRVVIGAPKSVCLGDIARAALQSEGLWDKVAPHVASYATSCENVLQELLLGEADVIVGWDVFARQHPDKVEALELPTKYRRARNIPSATIKWSLQPEAAQAFTAFLVSPEARAVWQAKGYSLEPPGDLARPGP